MRGHGVELVVGVMIGIASMLASCGNGARTDELDGLARCPDPPCTNSEPTVPEREAPRANMECCKMLGAGAYLVSSKVPVVTNVCRGTTRLWSSTIRPGSPLQIPADKIGGGGKGVTLQFSAGTKAQPCLDGAALVRRPATGALVEIAPPGGGPGRVLAPCRSGAGCGCPECPDPAIPSLSGR